MLATSQRLNYRRGPDVAEQRDLAPLTLGNVAIGTAKKDVGLNADRAQLLDRMLGRLGLELTGARNEGQQRQMDVNGALPRQLVAELADGLEVRQALDVTDRAADLDQNEVEALISRQDELLDGIGNMRDDLHRGAEIVAAPLFGDDVLIDAAGGDVVLRGCTSGR